MMSNMLLCLLKSKNHGANAGCPLLIPHRPAFSRNFASRESSKFYEDRQVDPVFDFLQIRRKTGHECAWRSAYIFHERSSGTGRRCNSSRSREVRHIRRAVIELPAKSNVLAGHVVKRTGSVPRLELIPWVFRKVWRARSGRRSIDRREQHEVAS